MLLIARRKTRYCAW